jgi:hypothetical protein
MSESLKEKAKTEIPCVECEVFQKTRNLANRALICETARACGKCLMIQRLEDAQEKCLEYAKLIAAQAQKYAEDKNESKEKLRELRKHSIVLSDSLLAVPKKKFEELLKEEKKAEPKYVCPARNECPYNYDACHDPTKFCRIIEDTPEHFSKIKKMKTKP